MDFNKNDNFEDRIDSLPSDKRKPDKDTYERILEIFKNTNDVLGSSHSYKKEVSFCKRYKVDVWVLVLFFIILTLPVIDTRCAKGPLKNCTLRYLVKILIFIIVTFLVGMLI